VTDQHDTAAALRDRWRATVTAAGATATAADVDHAGDRLLARWAEAQREYHTRDHLAAMLSTLDEITDAAGDATVELATWYHDAVYDPLRADNEDASARLAEVELPELGVPAGTVAEVARLVRLTASHDPSPSDHHGKLLCDADLAILAAAPSAYRRYTEAVRREYAHVDDRTFRSGRAAILRRILARPTLFSLPFTQDRWEKRARINVAMELSALTPTPDARKPLGP
jgi:predicted metal-dependent HD superfamily phosphohydrolase